MRYANEDRGKMAQKAQQEAWEGSFARRQEKTLKDLINEYEAAGRPVPEILWLKLEKMNCR